jgi:hypothetical protein
MALLKNYIGVQARGAVGSKEIKETLDSGRRSGRIYDV